MQEDEALLPEHNEDGVPQLWYLGSVQGKNNCVFSGTTLDSTNIQVQNPLTLSLSIKLKQVDICGKILRYEGCFFSLIFHKLMCYSVANAPQGSAKSCCDAMFPT